MHYGLDPPPPQNDLAVICDVDENLLWQLKKSSVQMISVLDQPGAQLCSNPFNGVVLMCRIQNGFQDWAITEPN